MPHPLSRRASAVRRRAPSLRLSSAALLLVLTACGGGGGPTAPPDGGSPSTPTTPTTPADPSAAALARALANGNAADVPLPTVMAAARAEFTAQRASYAALKRALFGLDANGAATADSPRAIDWNPTHDSSTFAVLDQGRARVVLPGSWRWRDNQPGSGAALGVAGEFPGTQVRFAAFGGNPLAERGNAAMDRFMKNTVGWLTPKAAAPGSTFKIVTAHLPGKSTYWFPHELKVNAWLAEQFPGATINGQPGAQASTEDRCDGDKLDACLKDADLLVIGRQQGPAGANSQTPDDYPAAWNGDTIMRAVAAARARGTPVLYLHHYRDVNDLASRMLDELGLVASNNYFGQEGPKAFDPTALPALPGHLADTQALLQRLDQGTFTTTWSGCTDDGKIQCEPSGSFAGDAAYANEFFNPASNIRAGLRSLDAKGTALFAEPGHAIEKLLVLLGDKYRETVRYPLDKATAGADFQRALFSDMTAYINRAHATVALNLGNFAEPIPAATPALSRTLSIAPQATGTREYMSGLYVMPGRTVTLTRSDGGPAAVTVGINMLRDTTRPYNSYDRPVQLASPRVALVAGKPLTLTSPYGGPLFLFVERSADATAVRVLVDGVTTHPMLRDAKDPAQIAAFKAELASSPTSWVGITTDFLTIHSNLSNFRKTMKTYGDDVDKLVANLWTYMVKDTYELAGFNSATPGTFALPATVTRFCARAGWDCTGTQHRRDVMQHVISDHYARCGAGCSGNPYDQNWPLEPLGWGETHEIGHNLQRARLKIYGGMSTEVSNNIFPNHKQLMFNRSLAADAAPKLRGGGAARLGFDVIKASLATADPTRHVREQRWTDDSYAADAAFRLQFYRQLVEFARHYNADFVDGWELYTLMYLLDRNFAASSGAWAAAAPGLGFGTYAAYPSGMDGNDFMVIAGSRIVGRDMRPVFDMWGVTYSAAASAQVTAYALPAAGKLLFPMSDVNRSGSGVGAPIVMTATAVYPAGF